MRRLRPILGWLLTIGAAIVALIPISFAWSCLESILMSVRFKALEITVHAVLLIPLIFLSIKGRKCKPIRLTLFIFDGLFLAVYLAMGCWCAFKVCGIPVPFMANAGYYNVPVDQHDYQINAIGWKGNRLRSKLTFCHGGPNIAYVEITLGYHHGLKQNLPSIAIRDFRDIGSYIGIVTYTEPPPKHKLFYEPHRADSVTGRPPGQ